MNRWRRRPRRQRQAPLHAVVLAAEIHAGAERAAQHGDIFAHDGQRLDDREAQHRLHRGAVADADAEPEAAAAELRQRERGLGHKVRIDEANLQGC